MIEMPNMLMIAGNSRNIGKTALACAVIERFSAFQKIYGLKVTSIRPGEQGFHGIHDGLSEELFSIMEEKDPSSRKDTSKMLTAGAEKAYYIRVADTEMPMAAKYLEGFLPENEPVVCESRSLRKEVKPGLFVFLWADKVDSAKIDIEEYVRIADVVIRYIPGEGNTAKMAGKINLENNRWIYIN